MSIEHSAPLCIGQSIQCKQAWAFLGRKDILQVHNSVPHGSCSNCSGSLPMIAGSISGTLPFAIGILAFHATSAKRCK